MASIEENIKRLGGLEPIRSDQFEPMSEAEVAELERSIGARLPEGCRHLLTTYGVCGPKNAIAYTMIEPIVPGKSPGNYVGTIDIFYAKDKDVYDIAWNIDCYLKSTRMPQTLLPIGCDCFDNQICIGIAGPERGKVYGWDHENEANPDYYTEKGLPVPPRLMFQNVNLIANSFEEFFDQMYVSEYAGDAE